jgi:hypothetical protein
MFFFVSLIFRQHRRARIALRIVFAIVVCAENFGSLNAGCVAV